MYIERRPYRNSQKRFYGEGKIYFITTVTDQRFPFFKENLFCELFIENLKICKKLPPPLRGPADHAPPKARLRCSGAMGNKYNTGAGNKFELYGFIIIPNHVHLLLAPIGDFNISEIMKSLKQNVSCDINRIIPNNECNDEGETPASRLHEIYNKKGIDIINYQKQFINKYGNPQHDMPKFKWQKSFYDHVIRNKKDFKKHLDYITLNSVKHGCCENAEDYKWSCLNNKFINLIDL